MAVAIDEMMAQLREAKAAQLFIEQARSLLDSSNDAVTFTCANPQYAALFSLNLPRTLWAGPLEQAIADAQAKVDAVTPSVSRTV